MHAHGEDEIYHVDAGSATINVEGEHVAVSAGDVVHLEPGTEHQFLDFEDELVMTVVYAPAKGSSE
jgi:mannose-6-phosphate isomerase-like protein (cupin superfamily)